MALVDSEAAFDAHCDKIDGSGQLKRLLHENSLKTFSQLAFVCGTPQSPPTEAEFTNLCFNINGGVPMSLARVSEVRRLHFESSTMVVAHLKTQVSSESQDGIRNLLVAEKQARLIAQQTRLRGVTIAGELQPSCALIDVVESVADNNSVIWVSPSRCSKRESEIQQTTKEKSSTVSIEQHVLKVLKVAAPTVNIQVDTSSELHLQWALMRRGMAYDQCGLIEWNTHQSWVKQLLNLLSKAAPEGYSKVRLNQLVRADRELFTLMAESLQLTGEKLTDTPAPMDKALQRLAVDPRVTMHILPLPKHVKTVSVDAEACPNKRPSNADDPVRDPKIKKKKKPSAKAKSKCPDELQGYKSQDAEGNNLCWAFNMKSGCSLDTKDGRCRKGYHKCMKCLRSNDSLASCRANAKWSDPAQTRDWAKTNTASSSSTSGSNNDVDLGKRNSDYEKGDHNFAEACPPSKSSTTSFLKEKLKQVKQSQVERFGSLIHKV